jgi:hypothetical protein
VLREWVQPVGDRARRSTGGLLVGLTHTQRRRLAVPLGRGTRRLRGRDECWSPQLTTDPCAHRTTGDQRHVMRVTPFDTPTRRLPYGAGNGLRGGPISWLTRHLESVF